MTIIQIIIGILLLGLALLIAFANSAAREANRISIENDLRIDGLNARIAEVNYFFEGDVQKSKAYERKANRLKARAEEVASRQTPVWKAYSRTRRNPR